MERFNGASSAPAGVSLFIRSVTRKVFLHSSPACLAFIQYNPIASLAFHPADLVIEINFLCTRNSLSLVTLLVYLFLVIGFNDAFAFFYFCPSANILFSVVIFFESIFFWRASMRQRPLTYLFKSELLKIPPKSKCSIFFPYFS